MEMEQTSPALAKKLWKIVSICIYMLKREISKSKLMLDLNMLLKKGKLAGKSLCHVMLHHHHAAMGCHSNDVQLSYISPKAYEFSCSNTPLYPSFSSRKKNHHNHHHYQHHHRRRSNDVKLVNKNLFDMLKKYETPVEASPLVVLPGFEVSPMVRQLRVTDSPFSLKGHENEDTQVDKMAEEFISKFYKELKNQKRVAALQSPSPYHMWTS